MNRKTIKIIGLVGVVLGIVATQIQEWSEGHELDEKIDRKIDAALTERLECNNVEEL